MRLSLPEAGPFLREICESRGGLYVKLGQILSLQPNVPEPIQRALTGLQSRNGQGSIGTVTRERDGRRWVAVKRRTPGIVALCRQDLDAIGSLSWWLSWGVPRLRLQEAVDELRRIVDEELDFRHEAANQRRMRKVLKPHGIHVPRVLEDATEDHLRTEWVDGALMTDVLAWPVGQRNAWLKARGTSGKKVARTLIDSWFRQVFEESDFHGDLHPGNILLREKDGKVVLIDFGSVGHTEQAFLANFRNMVRQIAMREYAWAADLVIALCVKFPTRKEAATKAELVRVMQAWSTKTAVRSLPYQQRSMNTLVTQMMKTVLLAGGVFNWAWGRLQRTMTTLDPTLAALHPRINYPRVVRDYFAAADARALRPRAVLKRAADTNVRIDEWMRLTNQKERAKGRTWAK